jgi:hypothetical protein
MPRLIEPMMASLCRGWDRDLVFPDRKQPPDGGQQSAAPGGLAAGVAPDLGEYGEW